MINLHKKFLCLFTVFVYDLVDEAEHDSGDIFNYDSEDHEKNVIYNCISNY